MMFRQKVSARRSGAWQRILPCLAAFMATLVSAPGHAAIVIPAVPLQSGFAYPPANIRFILDDSGSMAFEYMPDSVPATSPVDISSNAYPRNTLYYNPNTTYKPWVRADGTRHTGGTSYNAAYGSFNLIGGATINLGNSSSCARFNRNTNATNDEFTNSSGTRVCGGEQEFYVPKDGATDLSRTQSYWRYQILSGGSDIIRSEYGAVVTSNDVVNVDGSASATGTLTNGSSIYFDTATVQAGFDLRVQIENTSTGNNTRDLNYQVNNPSGASICSGSISKGNSYTCAANPSTAGAYRIYVWRNNNRDTAYRISAYTASNNRCPGESGSTTWINCTSETPIVHNADGTTSQRTLVNELNNFATWFSYHRTRIKTAKAGASEAFSSMGSNVRVGFDTIWGRTVFDIPVGNENGEFKNTNKTTWYSRLQSVIGYNGTPLHGALRRAGESFKNTTASGPWGPETGANQLSCRQNFAILTTDGYWNSYDGYGATQRVGDADATGGPTIYDPKGGSWTYVPARPYTDNFSTNPNTRPDTLADVAMNYWKNDLVSTLDNNVPTSTADPAFWQHMVTFGVSIGLQGRLNPKLDLPSITNGTKRWGDPTDTEDLDRIDDLWHASVNGRGTFVSASSPSEFTQGLLDALKTVGERLGSASNVTANSTSFASDTRVYQASYVSGKWTGELSAYNATAGGVAASPAWRAASQIVGGRTVYTWNSATNIGAVFPTAAQTSALDQSSRSLSPVNDTNNANYIKGISALEKRNGGQLRDRDSLLGDIVNSSPMYVKDSDTIFVGANDGMLHAFNAQTGAERFAYLPGGVNMADLATLSDPQYSHKYFVDGPVSVSTLTQTPGHNYLVGALGRGGKGVFGLDVTNPGSFSASSVLWENTTGANMGYVLGEPLIVTLNDAGHTKAVIVGNGINSASGHAALFVYNLATGALIQEIDTLAGGDNGLSAPRGWDDNGDGTVDYVYAGDLNGNLWKFNFTGATASIALGGAPLFTAASGQPITAGLALARDPATGKRWVFAGTGKFMENGDVSDYTVQSMYGIIDDAVAATLHRSDLQQRNITVTATQNGTAMRGFEANGPLDTAKRGWYVDLDKPTVAGERIVSRPQIRGSVLITASIIPPTNNSCEAGGSGYINAIDAFSGTSTGAPYFDANRDGRVDGSDQLGSGNDQVPVGSIDLGVGMPTLPTIIDKLLIVGGSTGGRASITVNPQGGAAQRMSWREILGD